MWDQSNITGEVRCGVEDKFLYALDQVKNNHDFYSSWVSQVFCRIEGAEGIRCSDHWHRSMEIWYTFSSQGIVEINGHSIEAEAGDIFVINSGEVHAERIHLDKEHQMFIVLLREEFLSNEIPNYDNVHFSVVQEEAQRYLRPILQEMLEAYIEKDLDPYYDLREKSLVSRLLYTLMSRFSTNSKTEITHSIAAAHPWLVPVMEYTRKNYMAIKSESEVCQKFAVSKEHFSRTFKKKLGITYNEFLNSIRLSCALKMLMLSNGKITDISEQVGFADVRTFITTFKKHYGMTPLQYKKKNII